MRCSCPQKTAVPTMLTSTLEVLPNKCCSAFEHRSSHLYKRLTIEIAHYRT
jgi:hypothetical protein